MKYAFITLTSVNSIRIRIRKPRHEWIKFSIYRQGLLVKDTMEIKSNDFEITNLLSNTEYEILYHTKHERHLCSPNLRVRTKKIPMIHALEYDHCGSYITNVRTVPKMSCHSLQINGVSMLSSDRIHIDPNGSDPFICIDVYMDSCTRHTFYENIHVSFLSVQIHSPLQWGVPFERIEFETSKKIHHARSCIVCHTHDTSSTMDKVHKCSLSDGGAHSTTFVPHSSPFVLRIFRGDFCIESQPFQCPPMVITNMQYITDTNPKQTWIVIGDSITSIRGTSNFRLPSTKSKLIITCNGFSCPCVARQSSNNEITIEYTRQVTTSRLEIQIHYPTPSKTMKLIYSDVISCETRRIEDVKPIERIQYNHPISFVDIWSTYPLRDTPNDRIENERYVNRVSLYAYRVTAFDRSYRSDIMMNHPSLDQTVTFTCSIRPLTLHVSNCVVRSFHIEEIHVDTNVNPTCEDTVDVFVDQHCIQSKVPFQNTYAVHIPMYENGELTVRWSQFPWITSTYAVHVESPFVEMPLSYTLMYPNKILNVSDIPLHTNDESIESWIWHPSKSFTFSNAYTQQQVNVTHPFYSNASCTCLITYVPPRVRITNVTTNATDTTSVFYGCTLKAFEFEKNCQITFHFGYVTMNHHKVYIQKNVSGSSIELNHFMGHDPRSLFVEIPEIDYYDAYELDTMRCMHKEVSLQVNIPDVFTYEDVLCEIEFQNLFVDVCAHEDESEYEFGYMTHNNVYSLMRFKQHSKSPRLVQHLELQHNYSNETCYVRFYVKLLYQTEYHHTWVSSQKRYVVDKTVPKFSNMDYEERVEWNNVCVSVVLQNEKHDNLNYVVHARCVRTHDNRTHPHIQWSVTPEMKLTLHITNCLPDTTYSIKPSVECTTHNTCHDMLPIVVCTSTHPVCSLLYSRCQYPIEYVGEHGFKYTHEIPNNRHPIFVKRNTYVFVKGRRFRISENHASLVSNSKQVIFYQLMNDKKCMYIFDKNIQKYYIE